MPSASISVRSAGLRIRLEPHPGVIWPTVWPPLQVCSLLTMQRQCRPPLGMARQGVHYVRAVAHVRAPLPPACTKFGCMRAQLYLREQRFAAQWRDTGHGSRCLGDRPGVETRETEAARGAWWSIGCESWWSTRACVRGPEAAAARLVANAGRKRAGSMEVAPLHCGTTFPLAALTDGARVPPTPVRTSAAHRGSGNRSGIARYRKDNAG